MTHVRCIDAPQDGAGLEPSAYVDPGRVLRGTVEERARTLLSSADGRFLAGVWECSSILERIESYPADEYMLVLSGRVTVSDMDGGNRQSWGAGESFLMPKGWRGLWETEGTFRKHFVFYAG